MNKLKLQDAYVQEVPVNDRSMRVDVKGEVSNPVIVLLPELG